MPSRTNDALSSEHTSEHTIGELAARYNVSLRTLRFYEQKGLLRPARRGAQRLFSDKDRVRLEIVILAKRLGFSLAEISELIQSRDDEPAQVCAVPPSVASLGLTRQQIGAKVEDLILERDGVQRAIEELHEAASRGGVSLGG